MINSVLLINGFSLINRTFFMIVSAFEKPADNQQKARQAKFHNAFSQEDKEMKTRMMKKMIAVCSAAALLAGCSSGNADSSAAGSDASGKSYTIGVAQLVDHLSLNMIRDSMLDEFEQLGYKDGDNLTIDYQNAAGQISNLDSIMSGYANEGVDAIVAIATPTAQSAQNYSQDIPVIFSAVSDPVGAGLVETIEAPGGNITGTSDEVQVDQIVDLMLELTPDAKTVGVLYNAGEANSVTNINRFKEYAESKGLTVEEKTGTDLTTLQQAASVLAEEVDVMFSPNDNTVASGMTALGKIAEDAGVPYYVGADSMVADGGFATVGINYEQLGRETAKMTIDILEGADPATTAVKVFKDDLNTYINQAVYDQLSKSAKTKTEIPADIKDSDSTVMVTDQESLYQ